MGIWEASRIDGSMKVGILTILVAGAGLAVAGGLRCELRGTHDGLGLEAGPAEAPASPRSAAPEPPPIRRLEPGLFACGDAQFSKSNRFVRFPAKINMDHGFIEYMLVAGEGKVHESLLSTAANPFHIHLAMLLIGAKGAQGLDFPAEGSGPLPGDRLRLEVTWQEGNKTVRRRAEECIQNSLTGEALADGHWIYNGSRSIDGTFVAQRDGSIVSVITDADALANNPRPGRDRDDIWQIRTNGLARLGTPVEVTLWLD